MNAVAKKTTVVVFYGAESKPFDYEPHELVATLLARALDVFHIAANRHLMALFTKAGGELPDQSTLEAAGVKPGEELILRQSTVKGG